MEERQDLISRQAAIDAAVEAVDKWCGKLDPEREIAVTRAILALPSAQPTLYGYNIEHLELIARVLQKENLPSERVAEALMDIGRVVAIVRDEFEESLRKAVEQCVI